MDDARTETYRLAAAIIAKHGKKAEFEVSADGPTGTFEWSDGGRHRIRFDQHWCQVSFNLDRSSQGGAGFGFRIPLGEHDQFVDDAGRVHLMEVRKAVDDALSYLKTNKQTRQNSILSRFLSSF